MRLPTQERFLNNPLYPFLGGLFLVLSGPVLGLYLFFDNWRDPYNTPDNAFASDLIVTLVQLHFYYSVLAVPVTAGLILYSFIKLVHIMYKKLRGTS